MDFLDSAALRVKQLLTFMKNNMYIYTTIAYTNSVILLRVYNCLFFVYRVCFILFFPLFYLLLWMLVNFFLRYTCSWSYPAIDVIDGPRKRHTIAVSLFLQAGSSVIFKKFILCMKLRILISNIKCKWS